MDDTVKAGRTRAPRAFFIKVGRGQRRHGAELQDSTVIAVRFVQYHIQREIGRLCVPMRIIVVDTHGDGTVNIDLIIGYPIRNHFRAQAVRIIIIQRPRPLVEILKPDGAVALVGCIDIDIALIRIPAQDKDGAGGDQRIPLLHSARHPLDCHQLFFCCWPRSTNALGGQGIITQRHDALHHKGAIGLQRGIGGDAVDGYADMLRCTTHLGGDRAGNRDHAVRHLRPGLMADNVCRCRQLIPKAQRHLDVAHLLGQVCIDQGDKEFRDFAIRAIGIAGLPCGREPGMGSEISAGADGVGARKLTALARQRDGNGAAAGDV